MEKRLSYLDVLKFIGILFIYVGHYLVPGNLLHDFVFAFHVPLFFVLSGFTENLSKETRLIPAIYKKNQKYSGSVLCIRICVGRGACADL